jgi:predicted DsbA family dithiol-disulfide isomerase
LPRPAHDVQKLTRSTVQVEIFSDVACPWCAIGKRRFEDALTRFEHRDEVEVRWRSFELDPSAPREKEGDYARLLAEKYRTGREQAQAMIDQMTATAADEGLVFRFDLIRPGRTFDAHRLLHLAIGSGLQDALKERLLTAYLGEGAAIGEPSVLADLAEEVGLERAEVVRVLDGQAYAGAVRADQREAVQLGIRGVPFFVIDRKLGLSGAQPAATILDSLRRVQGERLPVASSDRSAPHGPHEHGADCVDGSCAV